MSLIANTDFEERYVALRKKEGRIYSDEEVFQLPEISRYHPHCKEWVMRTQSMARLIEWLKKKNKVLKILEVGCGNGWFCNRLSEIENSEVTGMDINSTELQQAQRVFRNRSNVRFLYRQINADIDKDEKFDVILFAASIQYFQSLKEILPLAFRHLNETGEIHITDTHFYESEELIQARKRSKDYFTAIGFPEMANYYFHHDIKELQPYNFKVLYKPSRFYDRILRNNNPFPWICIKRN
jgi:ubiquinone/menaquinone biosynthesis C-methylase UbiE